MKVLLLAALACASAVSAQTTALDQLRAAAGPDAAVTPVDWRDGGRERGGERDHDRGRDRDRDRDRDHDRWRDHDRERDHDRDRWRQPDRDRGPVFIPVPVPVPEPEPEPAPEPSEPPADVYMSPGASAICAGLQDSGLAGQCLDAMKDRSYFGDELKACGAQPSDEAKISCLGASGRPAH